MIHFFDDDATIPQDYLAKIEEFFHMHPEADGGGPRIFGSYLPRKEPNGNFIKKLISRIYDLRFLIKKYGIVSRSCKNTWIQDRPETQQLVDWIPGCAMIFKPHIFEVFRFNSNMEKGLKSYALGEDMEFTFRVSRKFKLYAIDSTYIEHHLTPSLRSDLPFIAAGLGHLNAHMHLMYPDRFPIWRIYLAKIFELLIGSRSIRGNTLFEFFKVYRIFHNNFQQQLNSNSWAN